jgi:DNA polymerase phi
VHADDQSQLHVVPNPPFTEVLRRQCKNRLLACLADLFSVVNSAGSKDESEAKRAKAFGVATKGEFWVTHSLKIIKGMGVDTKHVKRVFEISGERQKLREEALAIAEKMQVRNWLSFGLQAVVLTYDFPLS